MKAIATFLFLIAGGGIALAHGGNDHVRGTVTAISPQAITVRTTASQTRSLALNAKTTFEKSGRKALLTDLKVGDRVVIDVPKDGNQALMVQFGTAPPKATAHQHAAP